MQTIILLECTECRRKNYQTSKNKKNHSERLKLSKYCGFCRRHTGHREVKA